MAKRWNSMSQGSKIVASVGCGAIILICCSTLAVAAAMSNTTTSTPPAAAHSTSTSVVIQAPAATATPAKPKTWVTVQHFTGSQNQQTPTFSVPDGARIVWSASANDQFGGSFSITSYNSDGTYGDLIANTSTPPKASGTFNVHGDEQIYLSIDTFGCTYDIQVQEYR